MRVLVACEYSGIVRDAFIALGHDAISCDLLETDSPGPHYQGDVFDIINNGFDLMIAHPPCTYLTNSGVCHLHTKPGRWELMHEGAMFFKRLLDADIEKKVIENPIMHKYAVAIIGSKADQILQPYHLGHLEQKAIGLHLRGVDKIKHTSNLKAETLALPSNIRQRLHYLPPSPNRWKLRSKTYPGLADALAQQLG